MNNDFFQHLIHEFERPLKNPVLIFSLILFIILLSPILLRKIKIPGIIGLIISGVVIGPHGLNILEKNSAVELFSTIGLLYIMFIAGLELDMNEFKKNQHKSLVFGFLTFIIPLSIGFPVCFYILQYGMYPSILISSMFATHTLVSYPIVSKFGISKNQAVAITVGGTILTDTAVLIILAVIIGSTQGGLNEAFWIRLGTSLTIFLIIMLFVIPRITKWFFRKLESEKTSHYIFVLSVVFFAAFLAEVAGVEPIIGAFVAGLALNKLIPHSSALMNRIEFIGNAIFIPFFLISVGMLVDTSIILSGPTALVVAVTLTIVAVTGKWIAAFFTQKIFKYSATQRGLIFGLSSAHAAATLAVILVGFKAGIIDENVLNGTIVLILMTCIIASFATENAAKKIVLNTEDDLATNSPDINGVNEHILLSIQEKDNLGIYIEFATLIKNKQSPNPVTILSVVPNNDEAELNLQRARKDLERARVLAAATETPVTVIATIDHNIASGITRTTKEIMADIIVLNWPEKSGLLDKVMGEQTETILYGTDKNIFVCYFAKPLIANKRIAILCPPLSELENGFSVWLNKIAKLSQELSIPIELYGNQKSGDAILKYLKKNKLNAKIVFKTFNEWEDFLILARDIKDDDILVLISSRKGDVSYQSILENTPTKLSKHFKSNTRILIYPRRYDSDSKYDDYEDMNSEPITKSIETLQKLGKGIGNIFKKE